MIKAGPCDSPIAIGFAVVKAVAFAQLGHVVSEESRTPAHAYKLDDEFASVAECVLTAAHDAGYHIYKASPSLRLKKFSRELTSHQRWLLLSYHSMSRFRMRLPSLSEVLL